jgi:TonB-dependent starch-binding outer membrane protein SusC
MRKMLTQSFSDRIRIFFLLLILLVIPVFVMNSGIIYGNESFQQEQRKITGTVVDASGAALPGVSILVKGTSTGTVTDLDGKFSIIAGSNDVVVFTFIGYTSQEITVGSNNVLDVKLGEDVIGIDEVVVTGYGVQKKSDLTGAIASVSGDKIAENPVASVDQALQGRAAGVSITQSTGMPGGEVQIQIRGISSINGYQPLVIVDGVHGSLNGLNPNDIESIEILKDASTAAIYGATGGNGVILVTTKKGKSGKMVTNFNVYKGWQKPWKKMDMMNSQQYAETMNIIYAQKAAAFKEDYVPFTSMPDTLPNYDWQDIMLHTSTMESYDLSFSGGGEKSNFFISANYLKQDGILNKTDYSRLGFRINSDHQLTKYIKVGENVQFTHEQNIGYEEWEIQGEYSTPLSGILTMYPYIKPYDDNGDWSVSPNGGGNPKVNEDVLDKSRNSYSVGGNAYMDITPLKGLTLTTKVNAYNNFNQTDQFNMIYHYNPTTLNERNSIRKASSQDYGWEFQEYINYNFKLSQHSFGLMAGFESRKSQNSNMDGTRYDLVNESPEMRYFNASTTDSLKLLSGNGWIDTYVSEFGRLNYDYNGKYLLTVNVRRDGSSRYGPDYRFGVFPSVSLGWKFSEEPFIKNLNIFSMGKIRFGYGETGANAPSRWRFYSPINSTQLPFQYIFDHSSNSSPGAALQFLPNREMHWEAVKMSNLGVDMGFFKNKINLTVDLFKKSNIGMLIYQNLPASSGMYQNPSYVGQLGGDARPLTNIGNVTNKGIEITLGYRKMEGEIKGSVDFNCTFLQNEVTDIAGDSIYAGTLFVNMANMCLTSEGYPISQFNGYVTDGLFTHEQSATNAKGVVYIWDQPYTINAAGDTLYAQKAAKPGDLRFVDANHDGKIDNLDKVNIGSPIPKFIFGFSLNLEYKIFDLNVFFEGKFGHKIFNGSKYNYMPQDVGGNRLTTVLDQYREDIYDQDGNLLFAGNTDSDLPRLDYKGDNGNFTRVSDFYIESGNYVRLKNIQLGVTIPAKISSKIGVDKLRLYVGAKNLLTLTNYTGFDPEIATSNILAQGIDKTGNYPQNKMFLIGLNLTF